MAFKQDVRRAIKPRLYAGREIMQIEKCESGQHGTKIIKTDLMQNTSSGVRSIKNGTPG
jgi:hypothetical protein